MKTKLTLLTTLASLGALACANAQTAVTPPAGYRTETLNANVFNLMAPDLSNAVSAAGDVDAVSGTVVTDTDVDFTTLLTDGVAYTLKITGGAGIGYHTEIASWTATELTTSDDLSSFIAVDDLYEIRATQTISDLFGAANEAGLQTGDADTADIVWIPSAGGGFTQVFYDTAWRKVGALSFLEFPNEPIYFTDGIFVQRRAATDLNVVFVGHVQTTQTSTAVEGGGVFNYLSRLLPVEVTLADSGLASGLLAGDADTGDVVWVPNETPGSYTQYFYDTAWRKVGALSFLEFPNDPLASGFIIQRRGTSDNVTLEIPAGLDL